MVSIDPLSHVRSHFPAQKQPCSPRVGGTEPIFSVIFPFFPNDQNSGNLYDIKFIFGRCHRSWAAETPGKCEHDWNYLNYNFAKSKFPVTEKLANGA